MNKAILISIRPEHVVNILNGTKTLELRKTVPKDYAGWVYIYCTKSKPYYEPRIDGITQQKVWNIHNDFIYHTDLNGKVVARFWFDGAVVIKDVLTSKGVFQHYLFNDLEKLCLDYREIDNYGKGEVLYAWHITGLEIFDKPLSFSEFKTIDISQWQDESGTPAFDDYFELKRAQQSWQYVYTKEK